MLRACPKASILTLGTLLAATPAMAGSTVSEDVVILPAEDPSPWYFAWYLTTVGDVDGDGDDELLVNYSAGRMVGLLIHGEDESTLGSTTTELVPTAADTSADSSAIGAGDVNDDGYDDMLTSTVATDSGTVYLNFGPVSGVQSAGDADVILTGEDSGDSLGASIGPAGDVNGDGYDDYLIGAPGNDDGADDAGAVYLVSGALSAGGDLSAATATIYGSAVDDAAGTQVHSAGDFDGDGTPDFAVTAAQGTTISEGAVYVFAGANLSGSYTVEDAMIRLDGTYADDTAGSSVYLGGDTDNDGNDDILVGATGSDLGGASSGAAYLVLGVTE